MVKESFISVSILLSFTDLGASVWCFPVLRLEFRHCSASSLSSFRHFFMSRVMSLALVLVASGLGKCEFEYWWAGFLLRFDDKSDKSLGEISEDLAGIVNLPGLDVRWKALEVTRSCGVTIGVFEVITLVDFEFFLCKAFSDTFEKPLLDVLLMGLMSSKSFGDITGAFEVTNFEGFILFK